LVKWTSLVRKKKIKSDPVDFASVPFMVIRYHQSSIMQKATHPIHARHRSILETTYQTRRKVTKATVYVVGQGNKEGI